MSRQENYVEDLHNNLKAYAKDESMKGNRQQMLAVVFEDRLWIEAELSGLTLRPCILKG